MRTLSVQYVSGMAGSEKYLLTLLPGLKKRGVDADMLVIVRPDADLVVERLISLLRACEVRVHIIKTSYSFAPLVFWKFIRLVRSESYHIVQANLIRADILVAISKFFLPPRIKIISVKHGYSESYTQRFGFDPAAMRRDVYSVLTAWAARRADLVVTVSTAIRDLFVQANLIVSEKVKTVHLGIRTSDRDTEATSVRFANPQILVLGRLVAYKQHVLILRAMPKLIERFPTIMLVVVGDGPLREGLEAEAGRLGIGSHVRWEGFRTDAPGYLNGSDVMVVPSASEGFGLVVLEAWRHSLPVIAFDVPAPNEIIVDGDCGMLVPPFDLSILVEKVTQLLDDPELRASIGKRGRDRLVSHFSEEKMVDASHELFCELLASGSK